VNAKYIVGVHDGHNAAAAILEDGRLRFAIQEERLAGKKNFYGFPVRSIKACLEFVGAKPADVSELALVTMRRTPAGMRSTNTAAAYRRDASRYGQVRRLAGWWPLYRYSQHMGRAERLTAAVGLGFALEQVQRYPHHEGHAATAYYAMRQDATSPHLVITCDGSGDLECSTVSVAERGTIRKIASTPFTDSLGTIYALVTGAMGFVPLEHEYKLMGMAPYASAEHSREAREAFEALLEVDAHNLRFRRRTTLPTFSLQRRLRDIISGMRFDNVCAGLQAFCEKRMVELVQAAVAKTGIRRVVVAGGVFMNVKGNKLLRELPGVEYLGVPPSCGDESMCFGIAWHAYARRAGEQGAAAIAPLGGNIYVGTDIAEADAEKVARESGFAYDRPADIEPEVARVLAAGNPVAVCRGRMEFGARALGNRSILADPKNPDVVRVINRMIKNRDFWMPFAPVVRAEQLTEYFVAPQGFESPYMMHTFDSRPHNFRDLIAAVHNADLSARAQTVKQQDNPGYYRILSEFAKLTGRGVLLNTSFNLHGYPVVHGPSEAVDVFRRSGLEYLVLGPFLLRKQPAAR
jgi:carbamoyltransferase